MRSARGTRAVRLHRKKSGLDFSVKGGKDLGIPVVVSWIKENGAAAKTLRLGDELLAVNGHTLQGLSHDQAVQKLRSAGPNVLITVRPNQTLEDIFASRSEIPLQPHLQLTASGASGSSEHLDQLRPLTPLTPGPSSPTEDTSQLPQGWSLKIDFKTDRPYFENIYTRCTTWTDPRTLTPVPLRNFEWNTLPPGWERFLNEHGDIYYVNHHTQTTHWDSPRGNRQQKQLTELREFLQAEKDKLKFQEDELKQKRELLLKKNSQLDDLSSKSPSQTTKTNGDNLEADICLDDLEQENPSSDLVDDIILLNDEVEILDAHVSVIRKHLHSLANVLKLAHYEDIGEKNEYEASAELAMQLLTNYVKVKELEVKIHQMVGNIEQLQKSRDSTATPIHYMLQLQPPQSRSEVMEKQRWLHVLPDKLTGKTNCELRIELFLLEESHRYGLGLQDKLSLFFTQALSSHAYGGWEKQIESLAGLDFGPLQRIWLGMDCEFREKLESLLTF